MVWYHLGLLKSKMNAFRVILVPFRVLRRTKIDLSGGENEFEPHPQNEIWYLLVGSFQNLRRTLTPVTFIW